MIVVRLIRATRLSGSGGAHESKVKGARMSACKLPGVRTYRLLATQLGFSANHETGCRIQPHRLVHPGGLLSGWMSQSKWRTLDNQLLRSDRSQNSEKEKPKKKCVLVRDWLQFRTRIPIVADATMPLAVTSDNRPYATQSLQSEYGWHQQAASFSHPSEKVRLTTLRLDTQVKEGKQLGRR